MQKLIRFRKAFYQKQNDCKNGNKKKSPPAILHNNKSQNHLKLYQSLSLQSFPKPTKILNKRQKKINNITQQFIQLYGQQILNDNNLQHKPKNCLLKHDIDDMMRARMIDWMIEVTTSYKFSQKTYFDSVNLMDRYFQKQITCLSPSKLHGIGVQCMLIASKMQQVLPLKISIVFQKIAHRKIPLNDLIQLQSKIIKTLNYQLNCWTFFDVAMLKVSSYVNNNQCQRQVLSNILKNKYESKENEENFQIKKSKKISQIQQLISYLSKFVIFDLNFYTSYTTLLLAQSVVKAAFQLINIFPLSSFYESMPIPLQMCKQRIFNLVLNFSEKYKGHDNIFKYTSKQIINRIQSSL